MSEPLHINPSDGPHAALGLSDHQLEYLCKLLLWEVSVRQSEDEFMDYLDTLRAARLGNADKIEHVKYERDMMQFEESVLADVDALPSTEDQIVF